MLQKYAVTKFSSNMILAFVRQCYSQWA